MAALALFCITTACVRRAHIYGGQMEVSLVAMALPADPPPHAAEVASGEASLHLPQPTEVANLLLGSVVGGG